MGKHSLATNGHGMAVMPGVKAVATAAAAGTIFGIGSTVAWAAPRDDAASKVTAANASLATVDLAQSVPAAAGKSAKDAPNASGWSFAVAKAEVKEPAPAASAAERESGSTTFSYEPVAYNGDLAAQIMGIAQQGVGVPYVYGGATPAGWDCSGFVMWVLAQTGRSVPHSAGGIARTYSQIPASEARPGDLVWWPGQHIAFYAGGNSIIGAQNPRVGTEHRSLYGNYVFVRVH